MATSLLSSNFYYTYDAQGSIVAPQAPLNLPISGATGSFTLITPGWAAAGSPATTGPISAPTSAPITAVTSETSSATSSSPPDSRRLQSTTEAPSTVSQPSQTSISPSPSQTSSVPSPSVSRTSLIATATVLGALLAIALIALLFLVLRRKST